MAMSVILHTPAALPTRYSEGYPAGVFSCHSNAPFVPARAVMATLKLQIISSVSVALGKFADQHDQMIRCFNHMAMVDCSFWV